MGWDTQSLIRRARKVHLASKGEIRFGQAIYNQAYAQNPAVAHLAGTEVDPYYDDARVTAFLDKLTGHPSEEKHD